MFRFFENILKSKIQSRLIFYYAGFAVITVALVVYLAYVQAERSLRNTVEDKLDTIAQLKADFLDQWVVDQQANAIFLASLPELRTLAGQLLDPDSLPAVRSHARDELTNLITLIAQRSSNFQDVQILDPNGVIVISASPVSVGKSQLVEPFFMEGQTRTFTQKFYKSSLFDKTTLTVATPLFDDTGKRIGVLALHFNMREVDAIISEDQELNEPIQSYLITRNREIISDDPLLLNRAVEMKSLAIDAALDGQTGVASYVNHNGVAVIGRYQWIENQNAALVVELDEQNAFEPVRLLAINISLIGLTLSVVLVLVVIFLAQRFTTPLHALTGIVARISTGDLEAVAPVLSDDEVGTLARAFNSMTEKLRQTLAGLQNELRERKQVQEVLLQFRRVMDETNDAIFLIDPETSRYIDFNRVAYERLGYSREELSQLGVIDIAQHITSMAVWRERMEVVRENGYLLFETIYRCKDGTTFPVEVSARMLDYGEQNIMVALVRDITSRKAAETALHESEEKFRKMFHSSPIAICISALDDGRIIDANYAYWDLTGLDPETSIGSNLVGLNIWSDQDERSEFVERLRAKRSYYDPDSVFTDRTGIKKNTLAFYEIVEIGGQERILSMFYDMSEQRRIMEALQQAHKESETLRESLASIATTFDLKEIVELILDQIRLVIPYDTASVWRVDGDWQTLLVGRNLPADIPDSSLKFKIDNENSSRPVVTGEVPYVLNNNVQDELPDFQGPHSYVQSWLVVPLKKRSRIIGLIALDGMRKGQFTEHHADLATAFADQAAIALENMDLLDELQSELATREALIHKLEEKNAETETVRESLASIVGTFEFSEIINRILDQIKRVVPYDSASIWQLKDNAQILIGERNLPPEFSAIGFQLPVDEQNHALKLFNGELAYLISDDVQSEFVNFQEPPHTYINSWLGVPMKARGKIIGLIALDGKEKKKFNEHHARLAVMFADQVAIALENARLFSDLQDQLRKQIALRSASMSISSSLQIEDVLGEICRQICVINDGTSAYIAQYARDYSSYFVVAEYMGVNASPNEKISDVGMTYYSQEGAWMFGKDITLEYKMLHADDSDLSPWAEKIISDYGGRSILYVPLYVQGRLLGHAELWDSRFRREFTREEILFCRTLSQQAAIAIANANLYEQLQRELTGKKELIAELESKNAELERFTYTVSHDLKSPLFTIRGFLGFLEQDALNGNHDRLQKDMQRIIDATEKMQTLLNDLLELSRIGRLKNESISVPFGELAQDAVELVQGRIMERGVEIKIQNDLPMVFGDKPRLLEVVQNLVDNATKFMGSQTAPCIEIGQSGEEDEKPILFVRDNGIGVAPEHFDRIFGLFNKLDVKSSGTGIGLALVKRIIEVHNGRIWVESEPGAGATFYFTLPPAPNGKPA